MAYSMADRAAPTAKDPIIGRVLANVFMARRNPSPGGAITFSFGTRTFLKFRPAVFEQRWPSLGICFPTDTPSHSRSTRNAQIPLCFDLGSTGAKTVTYSAPPPSVIQNFVPLRI